MKPNYHRVITRFAGNEIRNLYKESGKRYEDLDFRPIVIKTLQSLFKEYDVVEFSSKISWNIQPNIRHCPDLALISKNRRKWIIVEVELKHHSLGYSYASPMNKASDHIYPQVEVLAQGIYTQEHIDTLATKLNVNVNTLSKLLLYPPDVLVIGDDESVIKTQNESLNWKRLEEDFDNVHLAFIETYKWEKNGIDSCEIYSGWNISKEDSIKIRMALHNVFPNSLKSLLTGIDLPLDDGEFQMTVDGISTTWVFNHKHNIITPTDPVSISWLSQSRKTKLFEIDFGDELIITKI